MVNIEIVNGYLRVWFLLGILGAILFGLGWWQGMTWTLDAFEMERCWIRQPENEASCYVFTR